MHVDVPTLAFARLSPATDFGAKDGPADIAFLTTQGGHFDQTLSLSRNGKGK